jgi:hypothetical protein
VTVCGRVHKGLDISSQDGRHSIFNRPSISFRYLTDMHLKTSLGALVATSSLLVLAAPTAESTTKDVNLRLIKTSETEATWVTEEEKITKYVAKNINFIDVTDIKVRIQ